MSEPKCFIKLFCSVHFWAFFRKAGGLPNTKLFEELVCMCLKNFQERGGRLPFPKTFEELLCLSLDIFQEELA